MQEHVSDGCESDTHFETVIQGWKQPSSLLTSPGPLTSFWLFLTSEIFCVFYGLPALGSLLLLPLAGGAVIPGRRPVVDCAAGGGGMGCRAAAEGGAADDDPAAAPAATDGAAGVRAAEAGAAGD